MEVPGKIGVLTTSLRDAVFRELATDARSAVRRAARAQALEVEICAMVINFGRSRLKTAKAPSTILKGRRPDERLPRETAPPADQPSPSAKT